MVQFHPKVDVDEISDYQPLSTWVMNSIEHFELIPGEINFILVSDEELLGMNQKHLSHDYYTDVITFDFRSEEIISGDIYISVDRVRDNANEFQESFLRELSRVIIHGVLHIIGYEDKSEDKMKEMRKQEEFLLNLCPIL